MSFFITQQITIGLDQEANNILDELCLSYWISYWNTVVCIRKFWKVLILP